MIDFWESDIVDSSENEDIKLSELEIDMEHL